jgi:hypothetical protein
MAKKLTTKEGAAVTAKAAPKRQVTIRVPATKARTRKPASKSNGSDDRSRVTQDVIALRAYFISEQRLSAGLPGDSFGDWLEAERQLREETN